MTCCSLGCLLVFGELKYSSSILELWKTKTKKRWIWDACTNFGMILEKEAVAKIILKHSKFKQ